MATDITDAEMIAFLDTTTPQIVWQRGGVMLRFTSWPPPFCRGYHEESAATLREAVAAAMTRLEAPGTTWACPRCNHTVRADATWSPDAEPSCGRCGTQMLVSEAADA